MIKRNIVAFFGIASLVVGCSSLPAGTSNASASNSTSDLTVATLRLDFIPGGTQAPFFLALDRGYYRDEGIDLTIGDGRGSGATVQAVGAGEDTFGFAATSAVAGAVEQGIPLRSIGMITDRNSYALFAGSESGMQEVGDMCGKEILAAAGGPDSFYTEAVLEINGLSRDCVTLQNVDPAVKITTYVQGQGDGMVTVVPFGNYPVQQNRPSEVVLFADYGLVSLDFGMITSTEVIENDPDLVAAFVRASLRGWDAAREDPASAAQAVVDNRPDVPYDQALDQMELQLTFLESDRTQGDPIGCAHPEDWVDTLTLLRDYGGLDVNPENADDFYTNEFVDGCSS